MVWNGEDEEESSESPVEDRDKTMTATWDVMELDANTTFLQGETIDRGGYVILLKELVSWNKEILKPGGLRSEKLVSKKDTDPA